MARGSYKKSRPVFSLILGVVGTLAVVVGHLAGLDRRAELHTLDLRLLHASPPEATGELLHVDIDDRSLEEMGWPWPREVLAGVIDILKECGAQSVVLDIILPDPREVRWAKAAEKVYGWDDSPIISDAPPVPVFEDAILANAIRTGPDVFLPFHIDFAKVKLSPLQTQIEEVLASNPSLTSVQLAARLHRSQEQIDFVLWRARQNAINAKVVAILTRKPKSDFPKVLTAYPRQSKFKTHPSNYLASIEVIFCVGKTPAQVAEIAERIAERGHTVLATRATAEHCRAVKDALPGTVCHEDARCIVVQKQKPEPLGFVAVVTAGTSDLPVAAEAVVTAEVFGAVVELMSDVGVAGIHRLLSCAERLQQANAVVVVAGMEGALAGVVGGIVSSPVVAVPTSIGYGASFQGLAPLLTMLNSCSMGVAVVNIDNGFGAGYIAALINEMAVSGARGRQPEQ